MRRGEKAVCSPTMENANEIERCAEPNRADRWRWLAEQDEDARTVNHGEFPSTMNTTLTPSLMISVPRMDFVRLVVRLTSAVSSIE